MLSLSRGTLERTARESAESHCLECPECAATLAALVDPSPASDPSELVRRILDRAFRATFGIERFPSGTSLGRYVLLEPIGIGAMGVVFVAWDPTLRRKIALKLLRTPASDPLSQRILVHEARALARLRHPNVVAVYDGGMIDDVAFVAMEYVEGKTLAAWLRESPRSTDEILAVFVAAARGLAAAHSAGIIHRDFKPMNVFVGTDGRALVGDFGLARVPVEDQPFDEDPSKAKKGDAASTAQTHSGGTPAYLAPERRSGISADERSDQYSFCVALHVALYDRFPGEEPANENDSKRSSDVPKRVRNLIARGLQANPADRHRSMAEIIEALTKPRVRHWLYAGAAALSAGVAVTVTALWLRPPDLCSGRRSVERFWNEQRQSEVKRAFEATQLPYAKQSWLYLSSWLSEYRHELAGVEKSLCRAGPREKTGTSVLALQLACVDDKAETADQLTKVLSEANREVVQRSAQSLSVLRPLSDCSDSGFLRASGLVVSNGKDDPTVHHLRQQLARASALRSAGRIGEGEALAESVVGSAQARPFGAIRAEAEYEVARALSSTDRPAEAEKWLIRALNDGTAAHDDQIVGAAAIYLIEVNAGQLQKIESARFWEQFATSAIHRLDDDPLLLSSLLMARGTVKSYSAADGTEEYRQAYLLRRTKLGEKHPLVASSLFRLGERLAVSQRQSAGSTDYLKQALQIDQSILGDEHPSTAAVECALAIALERLGRYDEEIGAARACVATYEQVLAPDSLQLANALTTLGTGLVSAGRMEEGTNILRKAVNINKTFPDTRRPYVVDSWLMLGRAYLEAGKISQSVEAIKNGLLAAESGPRIGTSTIAFAHDMLARTMRAEGRVDAAIAQHKVALRTAEKVPSAERGCSVGQVYRQLAIDYLDARQLASADSAISASLAACPLAEMDSEDAAEALFLQAKLLRARGGERSKIIALAQKASTLYAGLGGKYQTTARSIDRWLHTVEAEPPHSRKRGAAVSTM